MSAEKIDKAYMALISYFPLVPLREKAQFEEAVKVMKELAYRMSDLSPAEADYLSVLGGLIAQYEESLPRLAPEMTPQEALVYLMEVNELGQSELVPFVGHKSNLSAFLNGHRGLSKRAASQLADYFKVSPALFLPKV
jgi:HTH-type transcriptional regulator/antitoxin HigA